jgi:DNA-binding protein H-NS
MPNIINDITEATNGLLELVQKKDEYIHRLQEYITLQENLIEQYTQSSDIKTQIIKKMEEYIKFLEAQLTKEESDVTEKDSNQPS